ncbi:MAG: hypothetical protein AAGB35_10495 [Pseudomonadota bacterium]
MNHNKLNNNHPNSSFSIRNKILGFLIMLMIATPVTGHAVITQVVSGEDSKTSVLFGNGALATLGLEISDVTDALSGNLGPNSVAFGINSRTAMSGLSTTFTYDSLSFAPFSGSIEHTGSVFFNDNTIEVGNFTIRAADGRPDGTSGFVVESTVGLAAILFDIANPIIETFENSLVIGADILVSPELAGVLQNPDFAGVDAGMALVTADGSPVPIPAAAWLFMSGILGLIWKCRKADKTTA